MFNLTKNAINIINTCFVWCYRIAVLLMLLILILQSDSVLNAIPLFNSLHQFLTILHKTPETVSYITDIQEIKENLYLLSNLNIIQDVSILELTNQLKDTNQTILNLKDTVTTLNIEYTQSMEVLTNIINELPSRIIPIIPEVVLPELNIKDIEILLSTNLEKQTTLLSNVLTKINEFSQLQKIQLEQGKLSYTLLCQEFTQQTTHFSELKKSLISSNQVILDNLSAKTKDLLLNLNTTNLTSSINTNFELLTKIINKQKEALTFTDFTKGLNVIKDNYTNINSILRENDTTVKDISSTLTGLDFNFHNKVNNLEAKVDNINVVVNDLNSTKVVNTEVQGKVQSIWNWNKK